MKPILLAFFTDHLTDAAPPGRVSALTMKMTTALALPLFVADAMPAGGSCGRRVRAVRRVPHQHVDDAIVPISVFANSPEADCMRREHE